MNEQHIPVLLNETVTVLQPKSGETYFDGTAGYGGHAARVLEEMGLSGAAWLVDRDEQAIKALKQRFKDRAQIIHSTYLQAVKQLLDQGERADMVLLDLGVSSPQLDQGDRGFSFRLDGPLDMRMDQGSGRSAAELVNQLPERELADLIYRYGGDRKSRRIAKAIVAARPIHSTLELADVVASATGRHEDIHPATRTFQALRIAVNQELEQLEEALPLLIELLRPGGRIAVISFHSLEDRIVKERFRLEARDCICPPEQPVCTCEHQAQLKLLTSRPIRSQDAINPRARSAKLRAAVKLKPKPKGDQV